MKTSLIRLLVASLASITLAHGEVLLESYAAAPSQGVVIANGLSSGATPGVITAFYKGTDPGSVIQTRGVGQAFRVTEGFKMNAITWQVSQIDPGVLGKDFSITIYQLADGNLTSSNSPGAGTLLSTQTGTLPTSISLDKPFLTFTLSQTVTLATGKNYAAIFSFTEPTSADTTAQSLGFVTLGLSDSPLSPVPRVWRFLDSATWETVSRNQPIFYVHAIPEASSASLLFSGGAILILGMLHGLRKGALRKGKSL